MAKIFTKLNIGDTVATSGTRVFKKLTTGQITPDEPATVLAAGLYDAEDNLVADWDTLVNTYGMDVAKDYPMDGYDDDPASPYCVLTNNSTLSSGTKMIISNTVTRIGKYAFFSYEGLTSVTIPNSVKSIGMLAFHYCRGLTSVDIGNGVTDIETGAFGGCTSLTSATIPNSVTSIGEEAFTSTKITSVTIGDRVTSIGMRAFSNCTSLIAFLVSDGNANYSSDNNGVLFNKNKTILIQVPCAFKGDYTIPDSVTSIGEFAISDCGSLTSVTIPNSVTSIGGWAIYECDSLTSVDIGNGVTSIGMRTICWCGSLTSVTIPDSVTSIGRDAFSLCPNITDIYYRGTEEQWAAIAIDSYNYELFDATIHYNYTG